MPATTVLDAAHLALVEIERAVHEMRLALDTVASKISDPNDPDDAELCADARQAYTDARDDVTTLVQNLEAI